MKMLLSLALCGLAVASSAVSAATLFPHVPLVMWSPRSTFAGSNAYLSSEMDEAAVASAVESVLLRDTSADKEGVLNTHQTSSELSEVMCLFLLPTLSSEDVSKLAGIGQVEGSFVQSAVQNSASSIVIPHTTRAKQLLPEMATAKPHIVAVGDVDVFVASTEGQAVLSNGKTDLLVVQIPASLSLPEVDAAVKSTTSTLLAASNGKTDFALTGDDAQEIEVAEPVVRRLASRTKNESTVTDAILCEAGYLIGYSAAGKAFCFSHYVSITPDIMAGLLFALLFVFMAYIGLSVLHQIQTPTRYPSHGAPRGKEF